MRAYNLYDRVFPRISALDNSVKKGTRPLASSLYSLHTVRLSCNTAGGGRVVPLFEAEEEVAGIMRRVFTVLIVVVFVGGDVGGNGRTRSGCSDAGRTTAAAAELREGTRSSLGSRSQRSSGDQPL
jgi:hypothetical protein